MSRIALAAFAACFAVAAAAPSHAVPKVFKYDEYPADWGTAVSTINGQSLNVQPGFVMGEAYGQIYRPAAEEFPLTITRIDLLLGAAPGSPDDTIEAVIEIYNSTSTGPDPQSQPLFTISTSQIFNPQTQDFGLSFQGGVAYSIEFDYSDPQNHPPTIVEGNIWVVVRFSDAAVDGFQSWGTISCFKLDQIGACGCQEVAPIHDPSTRAQSNVIHHVSPLGQCSGNKAWNYFETVAQTAGLPVQGDWILRMHADVAKEECVPDCTGRQCGDNGCGGSCGECGGGTTCFQEQCVGCVPNCLSRQCGDDGCGGSCGECGVDDVCDEGWCCAPDCDGRVCGGDGCGGSCGVCPNATDTCNVGGECIAQCVPACAGKACGDDGCGGVCGTCEGADTCNAAGLCVAACAPDCAGKTCGDDGCGGLCGSCDAGESCQAGVCAAPCDADCDGRTCGDDGCGGSCGACGAGESCSGAGACVADPIDFTVLDVSPDIGLAGTPTAVSITGAGFQQGASVLIGGTAADDVNVVSSSVITASVPATLTVGTYAVIVTNPGNVSATLPDAFTVNPRDLSGADDSGCRTSSGGGARGLVLLALLGIVGLAVRRRRADVTA